MVGWAGEEEEREGSEPHEERRTLCRLTIELDDEPACPPPGADAVLRYQHEAACSLPAA